MMPPRHPTAGTAPRFPVAQPDLGGNEAAYVAQAVAEGAISSVGRFVKAFEAACAAAFGARWRGRCVGGLGEAACFSFFGNKIVTTGEGGLVVTRSARLASRLYHLRDQAMSSTQRYFHDEIGFNYRMTALQAAVGLAQL